MSNEAHSERRVGRVRAPLKCATFLAGIVFGAVSFSCGHSDLRGTWKYSGDGNTYLIVADDDGGQCPVKLDGEVWHHLKGEPGRVDSGPHEIWACGGKSGFDIPKGAVYSFNYWGP